MDERGGLGIFKWLMILFALVLIAYGVLAVIYSIDQNAFRVPENPGRAWLAGRRG